MLRTFLVWAVVFLSGVLVTVILLPLVMGERPPAQPRAASTTGRPASVGTSVGAVSANPAPQMLGSSGAEPARTAPAPSDNSEYAYRAAALDTLGRFKAQMRDPSSVSFRNLVIVHVAGGARTWENSAVCGEVNARNGFGGFTGFVPFIAADTFSTTSSDQSFAALFAANCNPSQQVMAIVY
jgi:hypothetical protein